MLLEVLKSKQRQLELSDAAFARRLNVTRQHWQMTRTGDLQISERILRGVVGAFPELQADVLLFLRGDASVLAVSDSKLSDLTEVAG